MKRLILILLLSASVFSLFALDPPPLKGRINDNADLLSSSEEGELSRYLEAVEKESGAQMALLTIPSLEGDNLESFSYRTAQEWQLGKDDKDNGLLLLVALEERKIRIEVGYGLEGTITDSLSGFVIRNHIAPYFKRGDYAGGISEGLHTLGGAITGELTINPEITQKEEFEPPSRTLVMEILRMFGGIIFFFLFFFLRISVFGRRRRTSRVGAGLYTAHRMHTHSSGFSSGGFSGGGFSGGGGSFGGGGASGGW